MRFGRRASEDVESVVPVVPAETVQLQEETVSLPSQETEDIAAKLLASEQTLAAIRARLGEIIGETQVRTKKISPLAVHEQALGLLMLANNGPTAESYYTGAQEQAYESSDKRWSDQGPISPQQRIDRAELKAGVPLTRHDWLNKVKERSHKKGEGLSINRVFSAMLGRMHELTTLPERDMELERATVEMGFRHTARSDYDGNPFSFVHVRASEIFEASRPGIDQVAEPELPLELSFARPSKAAGVGHTYGLYKLGTDLGYQDNNAKRWFVAYRADGVSLNVPFDAITEVVQNCSGHGSIVEYPQQAA